MAELMVLGRCVYVGVIAVLIALFFSSRRRHTIWTGDWSSDVCSSDLDVDIVRPAPGSDGDDPGRNTSVNDRAEIGRASCRERVEISVVAVLSKKGVCTLVVARSSGVIRSAPFWSVEHTLKALQICVVA